MLESISRAVKIRILTRVLSMVLLLAVVSISSAQDVVIYDGNLNPHTRIGWTASPDPDISFYEVSMMREVTQESWTFVTYGLEMDCPRPKSGIFQLYVTAVRVNTDGTIDYSPNCYSIDPACAKLRDGTPGGWKIRWKPSAPTGPIIIY